jgi:NAD(P)-dependent dehydrogenase (short-subunit alcohol dehydrogenase family)
MTSMQGKICLITGGTNGIGKSTALGLARMGATVVIVGRNASKTARVVNEIKSATAMDNVTALLADLSSLNDVRRLAGEFKSEYAQLHVLINNAGAVFLKRQLSMDGFEMTFAVNHLAHFLLTNLLIDTIRASAPARIVVVSSAAHTGGRIDFKNLQGERHYGGMEAYGNSKLANLLFTMELARRLEGTGVTVNALHPGFVNTGFAKNNGVLVATVFGAVAPLIARPPEKGAATSIYLASSPEVQGITGKYFSDSKMVRTAPQAADTAVAKRLWEISAEMVHLAPVAEGS